MPIALIKFKCDVLNAKRRKVVVFDPPMIIAYRSYKMMLFVTVSKLNCIVNYPNQVLHVQGSDL